MKKLIFVLIMIITLTNVSFASFPVTMEYVISIDTIKPDTNKIVIKETTAEFHSLLEKEGFDIDNCMCEDCRRFKSSDIKKKKKLSKIIRYLLFIPLALFVILLIFLFILLLNWEPIRFSYSN